MKNKKTLEIGISDFKMIVEGNHYFVDKTALIYDFFKGFSNVSLITRPRRFGKTLNLSMIHYFFDINQKENLFSEYEISKNKDFCEKHQNKYPVINITLKDIDENNWEDCLESLKILISKLYKKHDYLLNSDKIKDYEKEVLFEIIKRSANIIDFKNSLFDLCEFLKKHFNKKVIVLVDEYDAPIIKAFQNSRELSDKTYYKKVINFMQTFLGSVFKGNEENLQKGMLTGVMRIGKESIFSKWNNLSTYGISSTYFADKFGFTGDETKEILKHFNLNKDVKKIKEWYDGYKFGNIDNIYNPWSIVNYISKVNDGFKTYWVNTSSDSLIRNEIFVGNKERTYKTLEKLISGKTITKHIEDNFVFSDFENDRSLLWTLLTYSGYLTISDNLKLENYKIKIPNYEINLLFKKIIIKWLSNKIKIRRDLLISTAQNLINNNLINFEHDFKEIIGDSLSYFDVLPKKDEYKKVIIPNEQFFHVYTLGLLAVLSDDYIIKSNKESGEGRYDIMLIPHNKNNNAVIIEIKYIKNQRLNEKYEKFYERINLAIDKAREQIKIRKYYKEALENKIHRENIINVPIIFAGKEPYINEINY